MAMYLGNYTDDLGNIQRLTKLDVYLFDSRNNSINRTSVSEDTQYLPSVFVENTEILTLQKGRCNIDYRVRFARLWLSGNTYLRVDLPFRPNTSDFNSFFIQVSQINTIINWGFRGEIIPFFNLNNKRRLNP